MNKEMSTEEKQMIKILHLYLTKMLELDASDLHIKSGSFIKARIKGKLESLSTTKLPKNQILILAKAMLGGRFDRFVKEKSADFIYSLNNKFRFRVNLFFQIEGVSGVLRKISNEIPNLDNMNMPKVVESLCKLSRGLILVTGPTGSGKSTTLASMINYINRNYKKHIISVEDPVEFVHNDINSLINQRQIGEDAITFSGALRDALREDPDIILIGEIRDKETIEMAMHAAETGHLVFSTLHTIDAKETLARIIGIFPGEEEKKIRLVLSSVLQGIISQRLIPTIDKKRVPAVEVLIKTSRIKELIKDNKDYEILDAIKEGRDIYSTQTFDQSLFDLYKNNIISSNEALENSSDPGDLQLDIDFENDKNEKEDNKSFLIDLK